MKKKYYKELINKLNLKINQPRTGTTRRLLTPYEEMLLRINPHARIMRSIPGNEYKEILNKNLKVSKPGDACEIEAEKTANELFNNTRANINKKNINSGKSSKLNINGGKSLNNTEKDFFENRFETDFSSVKIHNNKKAHELCEKLNASAFTIGEDIFFRESEYNTSSSKGKKLMAHELAHVVQQRKSGMEQIHCKQNKSSGFLLGCNNKKDESDKIVQAFIKMAESEGVELDLHSHATFG